MANKNKIIIEFRIELKKKKSERYRGTTNKD